MKDAELEALIEQIDLFPDNSVTFAEQKYQQRINMELFRRHVALTKQVKEIRDALSTKRAKDK